MIKMKLSAFIVCCLIAAFLGSFTEATATNYGDEDSEGLSQRGLGDMISKWRKSDNTKGSVENEENSKEMVCPPHCLFDSSRKICVSIPKKKFPFDCCQGNDENDEIGTRSIFDWWIEWMYGKQNRMEPGMPGMEPENDEIATRSLFDWWTEWMYGKEHRMESDLSPEPDQLKHPQNRWMYGQTSNVGPAAK